MHTLIILNRQPYDSTDVTWNALRLAFTLHRAESVVHIFLMNDAVDLARESCIPPPSYDQDLKQMLKDLIAGGVDVQVCGTCMARCGVYRNEPYYDGAHRSTMAHLAELVRACDRVLAF